MNHREHSSQAPYRILAAIGGPDHLEVLLALAAPLARARSGRVTPLYVSPADQGPPDWLSVPPALHDVIDEPVTIVGNSISDAVLGFARKIEADLLLLHWRTRARRGHYLLGRNLDPIIQYAPCDVAVLRASEDPETFRMRMAGIERILVPSSGGPNAGLALEMALGLGDTAQITALRGAHASLGPTAVEAQWQILNTALPADANRVEARVMLAERVAEGILDEASRGYDLLLLGATRENFVDRLIFGNLPQRLAGRSPVPHHHRPAPRAAPGRHAAPAALAPAQCHAPTEPRRARGHLSADSPQCPLRYRFPGHDRSGGGHRLAGPAAQ
jgi:nucleotide-binding universal stress UspA family protein